MYIRKAKCTDANDLKVNLFLMRMIRAMRKNILLDFIKRVMLNGLFHQVDLV